MQEDQRLIVGADEDATEDKYLTWLQDRAEKAIARAGGSVLVDFTSVAPRGAEVAAVAAAGDKLSTVDQDAAVLTSYDITGEMDAADLLSLTLPPLRHIVPGLVVAGTTVMAAPPKIGKSVLCYQLAVEVALGGQFLGETCEKGAVLYLALEDGKRRGQDRLNAALRGRSMPRGRLSVRWDAPTIGHGLEEVIEEWLLRHDDATLVMIDTIQRVRPIGDGRRNAYEVDMADLGVLQGLTRDRNGLALLGVHHTKKDAGDDFVSAVSGTYGIAGSADTVMLVKRKRHAELGIIEITGRELAEAEVPVAFRDLHWERAEGAMVGLTAERLAIYEVVRASGPIFPAAVARVLKGDRSTVAYHIKSLEGDGLVMRAVGGYVVADPAVTITH